MKSHCFHSVIPNVNLPPPIKSVKIFMNKKQMTRNMVAVLCHGPKLCGKAILKLWHFHIIIFFASHLAYYRTYSLSVLCSS